MLGNFVFYLLAEVVQGAVVFLAAFFVLKFLSLTQAFASVVIDSGTGFSFEPFISDPDKCLGLGPIGRLFSLFLLISVVFQISAFALRLQRILTEQKFSPFDYFSKVADQLKGLSKVANETALEDTLRNLRDLAAFHNLNSGLIVVLILMVVPVAAIAWWPVFRLRNYVSAARETKLREFRIEERQARQSQKYDMAKHLAEDMDKLTKASIWPNGYKIGWGSFFFLFALVVSTFIPPLIVPLVSGGLGLKLFNKITSD